MLVVVLGVVPHRTTVGVNCLCEMFEEGCGVPVKCAQMCVLCY
jgi:hypothetical protein